MPSYISKDGQWVPMREKVGLINRSNETMEVKGQKIEPGEPWIYDGPDRAALYELWKAKVESFGEDFRKNLDFLQGIRNQGFKDTEEYLEWIGYSKEKVKKRFEKEAVVINKHELPHRIKMIDKLGGGRDFAGQGMDKKGDFGLPRDLPANFKK